MRLCSSGEVKSLLAAGELAIVDGRGDIEPGFLDEYRLSLHLNRVVRLGRDPVDLRVPRTQLLDVDSERTELQPGSVYLGTSTERLRLSMRHIATLHTRSKYARIGLEMLGSSNVVVPGFGLSRPAPVCFEIRVASPTSGISFKEAYAFMLIFELDVNEQHDLNTKDYWRRFPLEQMRNFGVEEGV